jgi:NADP-dependent 3-hydroxy acid dehydrogenase YdfG
MNKKVIVITGASGGIGAALAKQLGAQGHQVVIAARRQAELRQVAEQAGSKIVSVVTDVTRRKDMEQLRDLAIKGFGYIDVWVNNAGLGTAKRVMELTEGDFDELINVNLKSVFYGIQTIIPHFQQRGKGHLINISSFLGRVPYLPFTSIYSAAKSAVNALTGNLRSDLKEAYPDIHVSLVMPGIVSTEFSRHSIGAKLTTHPDRQKIRENAQSAEEVARIIASLIENPVDEIYTNPRLADLARLYYTDKAAFEEKMRH